MGRKPKIETLKKIIKKQNKEIERLKEQLKEQKEVTEMNYKAYKDILDKFKKLAVAYCYEVDVWGLE